MNVDHREIRKERLKTPYENTSRPRKGSGEGSSRENPWLAIVAVSGLVLGLVLGYVLLNLRSAQAETNARLAMVTEQVANLAESTRMIADQLEADQEQMTSLSSDLSVLQKRVGVTASEIQRARAVAEQLRQQQEAHVESLTSQIRAKADTTNVSDLDERTDTRFAEVNEELTGVKEEVKESRDEIEKTWVELRTLGLQLTDQGNLIATNASGVEELRQRGERDYLEFNAFKKRRMKVGDVVLELRKADTKRKRADFKLYYDDREVERKRIYTNTPLLFYVGNEKVPYELVINDVRKDQILGYVSVPKGVISDSPTLTTG
jgi:hypothetical protein